MVHKENGLKDLFGQSGNGEAGVVQATGECFQVDAFMVQFSLKTPDFGDPSLQRSWGCILTAAAKKWTNRAREVSEPRS